MPEQHEAKDEGPEITVQRVRPQGAPIIYVDSVAIDSGYFGFKFHFGTHVPQRETPDRVIVNEPVSLGMSPEHAKSMYEVLGRVLKQYEETHGAIRKPPATQISMTEGEVT